MTKVSLERIADTLFPQPQKGNSTAYGSVESVNADGSYQVKLNASSTTTRAARLCDASAGDRVLVLIQANGHCAAIGRVGGNGGGPVVLYDDASGTTGTVTLASDASTFDYLRIHYKKNGDSNASASVDVHDPDGKLASLVLANSWSTSGMQFMGAIVSISGTSITRYQNEIYGNNNTSPQIGTSSSFSVAITRVEGWNERETRSANYSGGGEGHSYAFSGSGATPSLTEDGGTTGNAGSYTLPSMTAAQASAGTDTTPMLISPSVLKAYVESVMPTATQSGSNLAVE